VVGEPVVGDVEGETTAVAPGVLAVVGTAVGAAVVGLTLGGVTWI
jgi:hypothetical protein